MRDFVLTSGFVVLFMAIWAASVAGAAMLGVMFYQWYRGTYGAAETPTDQWAETSEEAKQDEQQFAQAVMDRMNMQMAEEDEMLEREARPYRPTPRRHGKKYGQRFDYYIADESEDA